jgi:hypothetical protein
MIRQTMMILASALLAGSLLATGAQARGGGGGHMGGFGGSHIGVGTRAGAPDFGPRPHAGRYLGGYGLGVYEDGLGCMNLPQTNQTLPPTCS